MGQEKVAYVKALEAQLKKQSDAVVEEAKIKKQMLEQQTKTLRAQQDLQLEEELKMKCLMVDQEAANACNALREAAITQQTAREEQTAVQAADYTKKKAIEDFSFKYWEVQKQWHEKEQAFQQQYNAVMKKGANAIAPSAAPVVQAPTVTSAPIVTQTIAAAPAVTYAPQTVVETVSAPTVVESVVAAPTVIQTVAAAPTVYAGATTMAAPVTYAAPATYVGAPTVTY